MPLQPPCDNLPTIFDVGLHKGEDSLFYLKKGFRVIGFEADPDLIRHCQKRFSKEITSGRMIIVQGAIIDPDDRDRAGQTVRFYKNLDDTVWGTVCETWAERNEKLGTRNKIIEVPAVCFTECLEKYGIPYYLKIDVEGMDRVCLKALLEFKEKPAYLSLESEKVHFEQLLEEIDLLSRLGYTGYKTIQQSGIARLKEPVPAREGNQTHHRFEQGASGLFGRELPGRWKTRDQIISKYKQIFFLYDNFGDFGKWRRHPLGRIFREAFSTLTGKPIPGWYDTHARHSSVTDPF